MLATLSSGSAAQSQLQSTVAAQASTITALQTDNRALGVEVAALQGKLDGVAMQIAELKAANAEQDA